jgi:hypothetical protein
MIGYHYTSLENYRHIRSEGLRPYTIEKPDLATLGPLFGVWVWSRPLVGDEHVGSILWQTMTKNTTQVVQLSVEYDSGSLLFRDGQPVEIQHDGKLGSWVYHERTPAIIITEIIPPEKINKVGEYDLNVLFRLDTAQKGLAFGTIS